MCPSSFSCPRQDEYKSEPGSVIAADFYGASRLLPLSGAWEGRAVAGQGRLTGCDRCKLGGE